MTDVVNNDEQLPVEKPAAPPRNRLDDDQRDQLARKLKMMKKELLERKPMLDELCAELTKSLGFRVTRTNLSTARSRLELWWYPSAPDEEGTEKPVTKNDLFAEIRRAIDEIEARCQEG